MKAIGNLVVGLAAAGACLIGAPARAAGSDMEAAAAATRAQWDAIVQRARQQASGAVASKAGTPPAVNLISIVTENIGVSSTPRGAVFSFDISSEEGIATIMLDVRSRDYHQGYRREITMPYPHTSGKFRFETPAFSRFNQPGDYDLRFLGVCDVLGQCKEKDYYGRDPVPNRSFKVINKQTPDLGVPQVDSAVLKTANVTTTSGGVANLLLKFDVSDDKSGVIGISTCARPPDESTEVCGWWELPSAIKTGNQLVTIPFAGNGYFEGAWHIAVVEITDHAGNQLFVNDPGELDAMFPNGRTFNLTNGF